MRVTVTAPATRSRHAKFATHAVIAMLIMLTYEGGIRKWVSPSLTIPLVGLRDLLALATVAYAAALGALSARRHIINAIFPAWVCLLIIWGLIQVLAQQNNLLTLAIGLRFWCLYIAFGIAIGNMIDREGLSKFIRVSLWIMVLMAPLVVMQFLSPKGAFINRQIGGDVDSVFTVAFGIVRTTGTFSFASGSSNLIELLAPLAMAGFMEYRWLGISRRLAFAGLAAVALCTAVAGSRAVLGYFVVLAATGALLGLVIYGGRMKKKAIFMMGAIVVFAAAAVVVLPQTLSSMQARVQSAAASENFDARLSKIFFGDNGSYEQLTWHGLGIGAGSGLASYVSTGSRQFVAGEAENGRIVVEAGMVGILYLMLKILIIVAGSFASLRVSLRIRSALPGLVWIGFIFAFLTWPSIGQLTANVAFGVYVALALSVLQRWLGSARSVASLSHRSGSTLPLTPAAASVPGLPEST